jgi:serine/threonine protein kinase
MSITIQKKKRTSSKSSSPKRTSPTNVKSRASKIINAVKKNPIKSTLMAITGVAAVAAPVAYALYKRSKAAKVKEMIKEEGLQVGKLQRVGQGHMNGLYYSGIEKTTGEYLLFRYAENTDNENQIFENSAILYKIFNNTNLASKDCSKMLILPVDKKIKDNEYMIIYKTLQPIVKSLFGQVAKSSIYEANSAPSDADVNWIFRMCSAINCLHSWGVAHRNITPISFVIDIHKNIFLLPSIETCNSTFLGYCHNPVLVIYPNMRIFTPPEMLIKLRAGDSQIKTTFNEAKKLDIWGLGVILYLYLFGKFPYGGSKLTYFDLQNMYSENVFVRQASGKKFEKYINDIKTLDKNIRLFNTVTLASSCFHDLLQGMLELDHKKRITANDMVRQLKNSQFAKSFKDTVKILEKNQVFN